MSLKIVGPGIAKAFKQFLRVTPVTFKPGDKMKKTKNVIIAACFLAAAVAGASEDVEETKEPKKNLISFGEINYGGTGCPAGSLAINFDAESKALKLGFENFSVSVGQSKKELAESEEEEEEEEKIRSIDRKSCGLAIPVSVPEGFQVSLLATEYQGNTQVEGGEIKFSANHFFAGQKGPKISVEFPAGSNGQFKAPFEPAQNELSVSACGQDVIVRANTSLLAKADEEKNHASASLNKALSFKFDIKPCGEQESEEEQVDIAAIQG